MEITAEADLLLLWLNDYKVLKENMKRKVSEEKEIVKAMTTFMKQLENMCTLQNKARLLLNGNKELFKRFGEQMAVVGQSEGELVKSIATRFVAIAI